MIKTAERISMAKWEAFLNKPSHLILQVIMHHEVVVKKVPFFRVVKKKIAVFTKVARVFLRPLVIKSKLFSPVNVADIAFLSSGPKLKCNDWISSTIMYVLRMDQPHISNHYGMFAISLCKRELLQSQCSFFFKVPENIKKGNPTRKEPTKGGN